MPTEMTIEAAMIELNRLKSQERMDIDRERLTAAIDVLKDAAQFRIARKTLQLLYCPKCTHGVSIFAEYCSTCGQALDWSSL